jgi:hypothetical protein
MALHHRRSCPGRDDLPEASYARLLVVPLQRIISVAPGAIPLARPRQGVITLTIVLAVFFWSMALPSCLSRSISVITFANGA